LEKGEKAPAFTLKNAEGKDISLSDFKGKIVLIDFWGTWCGPCQMAMPAIQKVHAKFKDKGVVVIGISCREKPSGDPAKMMKDKGCDYDLLLNGEKITSDWHVPGYPTMYLIDREGRIAYSELGYDEELEGKVSEAIDRLPKE
jgi:peroxiredoxin